MDTNLARLLTEASAEHGARPALKAGGRAAALHPLDDIADGPGGQPLGPPPQSVPFTRAGTVTMR
jgi:hypothetical protein